MSYLTEILDSAQEGTFYNKPRFSIPLGQWREVLLFPGSARPREQTYDRVLQIGTLSEGSLWKSNPRAREYQCGSHHRRNQIESPWVWPQLEHLRKNLCHGADEHRGSGQESHCQSHRSIEGVDLRRNQIENERENSVKLRGLSLDQSQAVLNCLPDKPDCELLWKRKRWPRPLHSLSDLRYSSKNHSITVKSHQNTCLKDQEFFPKHQNSAEEIRQEHLNGRPSAEEQLWSGRSPCWVLKIMGEGRKLLLWRRKEEASPPFFRNHRRNRREVRQIQLDGRVQRCRHLPDHPLHSDAEVPGQGRQKPLQILPAQPEPDRHQNLQNLLLAIEAVWRVEGELPLALQLLQYPRKNNRGSWSINPVEIETGDQEAPDRQDHV